MYGALLLLYRTPSVSVHVIIGWIRLRHKPRPSRPSRKTPALSRSQLVTSSCLFLSKPFICVRLAGQMKTLVLAISFRLYFLYYVSFLRSSRFI